MADEEIREDRKSGRPMGRIFPHRIQQISRGETPVVKVGWTPEIDKDYEKPPERKIGDRWMDEDGNEWEQKNGYKMKLPKYLDEINKVDVCPKCGKTIETRLDKKFYVLRKNCFDCQIKFETKLRISGGWEEYQKSVIEANYIAFLKDSKTEIEEYLADLKNKMEYVTPEGKLEKWEGDTSQVRQFFINELKNIDEALARLEMEKNGEPGIGTEIKESN